MKNHIYLFFALQFFSIFTFGQEYRTIRGKVYDKQTNEPVPYAHVGILEKGIGTTTSDNGIFVLKVPEKYLSSTMMVSCIGYKTWEKPIREIESPVRIYLAQNAKELNEVLVMAESAVEDIIRKAVNNIPKNYPTHPTTVTGFYRESRTDDSLNHVYLAEGVLKIYKKGYDSKKEGQVSLVQGRLINLQNPLDTTVASHFSSGHMAAHRFDFVKNRVDFIDERFFPVYKYWIENITWYNDRKVFIIGFDIDEDANPEQGEVDDEWADSGDSNFLFIIGGSKKSKKKIKARMRGRIYIEQESYAFVRAEFEITEEGLKKTNDYPLYAGSWKGNSYVVNYRKLDDTWYFSDALREGKYGGGGLYNNEIKITEIDTEKSGQIPYNDRLRRGEKFTSVTGEYDENFWKSYNTTPLNEGLAESISQMETMKKAQEVFDEAYLKELQIKRDSIQAIEARKIQAEAGSNNGFNESSFFEPNFAQPQKKKQDQVNVQFMMGLGSHFIKAEGAQLGVTYFSDATDHLDPIISTNNVLKPKDFEVVWNIDMDVALNKNFFARFGLSGDFTPDIYREHSIGFGAKVNLSKQRPFYFKTIASLNNLRYARKIGKADNDYGTFRANGKKFNADKINMYYGSRTLNGKLAAEFSIELNPNQELYIRGFYLLPITTRQDLRLREKGQFFNKKHYVPLSLGDTRVVKNGEPFRGSIFPDQTFGITLGLLFK